MPLDGKLAVEELIKSGEKFSAVVCGNDFLAQGAIEGLIENNPLYGTYYGYIYENRKANGWCQS